MGIGLLTVSELLFVYILKSESYSLLYSRISPG